MIEKLEPLLVKHKVDVYFAGHDHTLEMLKPVKGVNYVVSGAAGGPDKAYNVTWSDDSFYAATLGGFVACRASKACKLRASHGMTRAALRRRDKFVSA